MASPSAGAPALKYGDANTETTSPREVKGLIIDYIIYKFEIFLHLKKAIFIFNYRILESFPLSYYIFIYMINLYQC